MKRMSNDDPAEEEEEEEKPPARLGEFKESLTDVDEVMLASNDAPAESEEEEENLPARLGEVKESLMPVYEVELTTGEEEVDWPEDNDGFVATELLTQELVKEVTNEVLKEIEERAAVAEIRDDMKFVDFLQALPEVLRSDADGQTPIGKMQAFKAREPEFVRWRSVRGARQRCEPLVAIGRHA